MIPETYIVDRNAQNCRKVAALTEWDSPEMRTYFSTPSRSKYASCPSFEIERLRQGQLESERIVMRISEWIQASVTDARKGVTPHCVCNWIAREENLSACRTSPTLNGHVAKWRKHGQRSTEGFNTARGSHYAIFYGTPTSNKSSQSRSILAGTRQYSAK